MPNHPVVSSVNVSKSALAQTITSSLTSVAPFGVEAQQDEREEADEQRNRHDGEGQRSQIAVQLIGQQHLVHEDRNNG